MNIPLDAFWVGETIPYSEVNEVDGKDVIDECTNKPRGEARVEAGMRNEEIRGDVDVRALIEVIHTPTRDNTTIF